MTRTGALSAAAFALALLALSGCSDRCTVEGCPEGEVCSLRTDNCVLPASAYGPSCLTPTDCDLGVCIDTGTGVGMCTGECGGALPACPGGFACAPVGDGSGGRLDVCMPAGDGAVGAACALGTECASGLCLPLDAGSACSAACDYADPAACGEGNVGCQVFQDAQGGLYGFCVAGGTVLPGQSCPNGITDCDLSMSDACLSNADGSLTLCAPACPNGADDCSALPGSCCADLGDTTPAPFCLPAQYCPCEPDCMGRTCGDDGCGGSCGSCGGGEICQSGTCTSCVPACAGHTCGDDGCGGSCGTCAAGEICRSGTCSATCTPACEGRACGGDGCGGLCGTCAAPDRCHDGDCVDPSLLLVDMVVRDPALDPPALWGLAEYHSAASIGPPLDYRQGPQADTTQELLCGSQIVCSDVAVLASETAYELVLGYGADRAHCAATFVLHDGAPVDVDGGDCLVAGGGPFGALSVVRSGDAVTFDWSLP